VENRWDVEMFFVSALSPGHFKLLEGSCYVEVEGALNKKKF